MKPLTRNIKIAIVVGSAFVAGSVGYLIYKVIKNPSSLTPGSEDEFNGKNDKDNKANDDFPLKLGSVGNRVIRLNCVLGLPMGNIFTKATETEVLRISKGKQNYVTRNDFEWYDKYLPQAKLCV